MSTPPDTASQLTPLLDIKELVVEYSGKGFPAPPFRAIRGVSLDILPGETMGLEGESGSGTTTLGRATFGPAPVTEGAIVYDGKDMSYLGRQERRALSSETQVVFQNPYSPLNPSMTFEQILTEPLTAAAIASRETKNRVRDLLDQVGLPADARGASAARVLRRAAPARRDRPGARAAAAAHRV